MAEERARVSRNLWSIGGGPALATATMFPQKGWLHIFSWPLLGSGIGQRAYSPKNGTIAVGRPFNKPHAVVPAPP
jgi:hypothetical protein